MVKNFGHPVKVAVQKYTFYRIGLYETGLILYVAVVSTLCLAGEVLPENREQ